MTDIRELGRRAKEAAFIIANADTEAKNAALIKAAHYLRERQEEILSENKVDADNARDRVSPALLDRLTLDDKKIEGMAEGLLEIAALPDPVNSLLDRFTRPNGLIIEKRSVPLGVIGIIYESRPNVTADAFGLCFKAGNAAILRGGSDAIRSNLKIGEILQDAVESEGLPRDVLFVMEDTSRESAKELMRLNDYVDLLIPRGGAGLIKSVVENSTVPVIETGVGNCHIYVDASADIDMAVKIIVNAKTQRMGVCNAAESLVVHSAIAPKALPAIGKALLDKGIELRGDSEVQAILKEAKEATEEDYGMEYLGPIISVKIVDSIDEAISHVNRYTTHHSEAIITENNENGERFLKEIDAACVYVNASTRFTDGFEFGFGAEIGISTQKFHARGPMGLNAITSYKYEIRGNGQIRG